MTDGHERPSAPKACGCGGPEAARAVGDRPQDQARVSLCLVGRLSAAGSDIPQVSTRLKFRDHLGVWRVRFGVGRNGYRVPAGLYAAGRPDSASPVLVTANYKLSFDSLRRELPGRDAWILVLDTQGINVWCAAGKGTFGTAEIIRRVAEARLDRLVSHRKLILPQLGAPGVAAHEVQKQTGFRVVYGPVLAKDLGSFLDRGMKATPEMRRVRFGFRERLTLVPVELVQALPILLLLVLVQVVISLLGTGRVSARDFPPVLGAVLAGCAVVPALLPWIPGRAFAFKGWLVGVVWVGALQAHGLLVQGHAFQWRPLALSLLLLPIVSAYVAMNFTGSSTFTSLSGVVKEMSRAVPLMLGSASLYVVLFILTLFIKF